MNSLLRTSALSVIALAMVFLMAGSIDAQRRSERDVRDAVRSLNSNLEDFEYELRYQMQSSSTNVGMVSEASDNVRSLRDSVRFFEQNLDRKRENRDDVDAIVRAAQKIEFFLKANRQNRRVEDNWMAVRRQIDRLGSNYGVTANWNVEEETQDRVSLPPVSTGAVSVGLSGTYELDMARSENVEDILQDTKLGTQNRDDLKEKLEAPSQIAIDIRGENVTLATSNAPAVTFTADGRDKRETSPSGRSVRLRATLSGDTLIVSSVGGETDYNITFTSLSDGRSMKVARRITTDYLSQTVFAESVYNKTDSVARLDIGGGPGVTPGTTSRIDPDYDPAGGYSDNDQQAGRGSSRTSTSPRASTPRPGNYTVPNGTAMTGILENEINTGVSQNNDRFRLTVQAPDEFRGAVIEGYLSNITRTGKVTGQATVTLNFESITLRSGQRFDFAAFLTGAQALSGKNIQVDNESTLKGDNQTTNTAKRGGIGAGIGAVIGAIAGGAKGAAIGAVIGAGGGAGSVAVQGRDDIRLQTGSTISLISSSPLSSGPR